MRPLLFLLLVSLILGGSHASEDDAPSAASSPALELAPGLTIRMIADDDLVPDCGCLTVDKDGAIVCSGPGYIRRLIDANGDDKIDSYETLLDGPDRGAHGLCFDGDDLFFVGNGGVWRKSESDLTRMLPIKTGGEHHAHALRKGPDHHWYLIAGNGTEGMFSLQNVVEPAIPSPRAGAIWRISPDWKRREVWAHGFRNAYDFDFAPGDAIDTFDSDGERDVSLPWYRPTRLFRVRQGDDAGWFTRSWKRPASDPQMPRVVASFGRGSPTGVLRYRHRRLPQRFEQGLFLLDWTFGRVIFVSDQGGQEIVATPSGHSGFAVTDIGQLHDGRLVISVGGRKSRGGVYLLDAAEPRTLPPDTTPLWTGKSAERNESAGQTDGEVAKALARLRDRPLPTVDRDAADLAINSGRANPGATSQMEAMALLTESVGGLGVGDPKDARGKEQVAAVFDGYRSRVRPKLSPVQIRDATHWLIGIIERGQVQDPALPPNEVLIEEAIRTLAVIEPESAAVFQIVLADLQRVTAPTAKLHRLIALARIPVRRDDEMTDQVAESMLTIVRSVRDRGQRVDRNWQPRMAELYLALQRRDSLLPSRLVSQPSFGKPADLVWTTEMDPENLERARVRCLSRIGTSRSGTGPIDPEVARFVAEGNDAVPRRFVRRWLEAPATRDAALLAIARHAAEVDIPLLREASVSPDGILAAAARDALRSFGQTPPARRSASESVSAWLARGESVLRLAGDPIRGQESFVRRQCARCHDGAKAIGPALVGLGKRFSRDDTFRATVDPSQAIPDRYRAKRILTTDGEVLTGIPIYESVDGVTLLSAEAMTLRINADSISRISEATQSLMPTGLLDGMSDQQVADLIAYLRSL